MNKSQSDFPSGQLRLSISRQAATSTLDTFHSLTRAKQLVPINLKE